MSAREAAMEAALYRIIEMTRHLTEPHGASWLTIRQEAEQALRPMDGEEPACGA